MPIRAVVRDEAGAELRGLPDPAGGTFDAAGDFDRLLEAHHARGLLGQIDPYTDTQFGSHGAAALVREIDGLLEDGTLNQIERRGLTRLRVMAERVASDAKVHLWFIGD